MQHVTHDTDASSGEITEAITQCEHIEQPLRRMFVRAVAGIDHVDSMRSARKRAAPDAGWRMTTMSILIASRLRAVSTSVSPLATLEPATQH